MSKVSLVFDKKPSQHPVAVISRKIAPIVPLHLQIKGLDFFVRTSQRVYRGARTKPLQESDLPDVSTLAIEDIDVSNPFLFKQNKIDGYLKRLRNECPIHYQKSSPFGPFWSITRFDDIMFVDKHHELFSAEPVIFLGDVPDYLPGESFIAMDPPRHDERRQAVQGVVAPRNLAEMERVIRKHVEDILDGLPIDQAFDWVDKVSIELTTRMLSVLFDFPYEERHKLPYWSDLVGSNTETTGGVTPTIDFLTHGLTDMAKHFADLWYQKAARKERGEELGFDLISLLLTNEDTKDLIDRPMEFLGDISLLIVGGNDTTRNSITGGVLALNQFPEEFRKLKKDPRLIPNMVSEIIRWQTPLAYMRRIAREDVYLNGQFIRKGDKLVMWYASGNRDERKIENPDQFIIDRNNARNHLAFGFGIHRCMGNRLAEMQLRVLWEEILKRFDDIEVLSEPERVQSNFVRGYKKMKVKLTAKS